MSRIDVRWQRAWKRRFRFGRLSLDAVSQAKAYDSSRGCLVPGRHCLANAYYRVRDHEQRHLLAGPNAHMPLHLRVQRQLARRFDLHSVRHPSPPRPASGEVAGAAQERRWKMKPHRFLVAIVLAQVAFGAHAAGVPNAAAARAAIHPVGTAQEMQSWLSRVPRTRDFPADLPETLRAQSGIMVIEMSSAPGCLPCADLWWQVSRLGADHGWRVQVIAQDEAMLRSGRLGLPWVGHPVLWVRPLADPRRAVPVAIGTDHEVNLRRNIYLATKMLTGVRAAVGLRAMSKFTGIVGGR